MNAHCELLLEEFKNNQKSFEIVKEILLQQLKEATHNVGCLINCAEARIKAYDSLKGKLEFKGTKYKVLTDITDLVGARIVTFYTDEIDKFAAEIEKRFKVDWQNSVDKRKIHDIDQFGYMSVHYIVSIPETLYKNDEYPLVNTLRCEIQLRSILQHTWATIYHDTGYKSDVEVPKDYLRELNCLAGMLELADRQFLDIRNSIDDYRRRVRNIVKSGKLEDVELNKDSFEAYLDNEGFYSLNLRIASINNIEIEEVSLMGFLPIFKGLKIKTLKELDDLVKEHSDDAYNFAVRQYAGLDIDIMTNATAPLFIAMICCVINGGKENELVKIINEVYGDRRSNKRYAQKVIEICKNMGLIKEEE